MAAERLGVPIDNCVVFEDAQQGMEAAERAGETCYTCSNGTRKHQLTHPLVP